MNAWERTTKGFVYERYNADLHILPPSPAPSDQYSVIIIDNDYNTYLEVIEICMEALSISFDEAYRIALAVDNNGRAEVFQGSLNEARLVAETIRRIGIQVELRKSSQ